MKRITLVACCIFAITCLNAQTWTMLNSGTTNLLSAVHFPTTTTTGYTVGDNGTILKTTNGGSSWSSVTSNYSNYSFSDVHFVTTDIGFVCGENDPGQNPAGAGIILKTIDGGTSWTELAIGLAHPVRDLFVLNENEIYAAGGAELLFSKLIKSEDGGATWSELASYYDAVIEGLYFTSSDTGYVGIYESAGGDVNPTLSTWLSTTDGGTTFNPEVVPNSVSYWNFDTDFENTTGYSTRSTYSSNNVYIRKTTDNGATWVESTVNVNASPFIGSTFGLDFVTEQKGYIVGDANSAGIILKTNDGGDSWTFETINTANTLYSVHFPSSNVGYVVGDGGSIFKYGETTNNITNLFDVSGFSVYPNPTTTNLNVKINSLEDSEIQVCIVDITGRRLTKDVYHLTIGENQLNVDTEKLTQGTYFVSFYTAEKEVGSIQFLKE